MFEKWIGSGIGNGTLLVPHPDMTTRVMLEPKDNWWASPEVVSAAQGDIMRGYLGAIARTALAPAPGPVDLPSPTKIAVADDVQEYIKAAHAVGFRSPEVERMAFMKELQEVGCEVYDYDHVDRFLRAEAQRAAVTALRTGAEMYWTWKPISWDSDMHSCTGNILSQQGNHASQTYTKTIPIEALRLMKIVADRVPDVRFYVSDYEVRVPDPFLLVMRSHDVQAVIYHWDEPGFTMKVAEVK